MAQRPPKPKPQRKPRPSPAGQLPLVRVGGAGPGAEPQRVLTQKKQPQRSTHGAGEAEQPRGRLPAGRQGAAPTAKRRAEETLARLGKETALDTVARLQAERDRAPDDKTRSALDTQAKALREWVNRDHTETMRLLASLPATRGGNGRELRLSMCGVAFVAKRGERVNFARRGCKDRLCPDCSARRSRRLAASLRDCIARRAVLPDTCDAPTAGDDAAPVHAAATCGRGEASGGCAARACGQRQRGKGRARCSEATPETRILFVTLTQRKHPFEEPKLALDRLLESFRRFRQSVFYRRQVVGGLRSIECTARAKGDRVGDYVVGVPGIHAHLHCLLEVRAGVRAGDIRAAWVSVADAEESGVDVQAVNDANVYQCCDYPVNMSGLLEVLTAAPDYVRRVVQALHGRRLVELVGAWREWPVTLREAEGDLVYGDRAVYTLCTNDPDAAASFKWANGNVEPTEAVLAAFLDGPKQPL